MKSGASRIAGRGGAALAVVLLALLLGAAAGSHDAPPGLESAETGPFWAGEREDLLLDFVFRTQNVGNLALSVSNHGFLGNNFADRSASMEYPKGSEVDHMIRGGLWIGGINTDFDTLVTTGVQDGYWGTYTRPSEFVPRSIPANEVALGWIREKSSLVTSPYYSPEAVSEQDFSTAFVDTLDHPHTPETGNADDWHSASGLIVEQDSYTWSYEPADAMVIVKYTLKPTRTLLNAYAGIYAEMTTGWKGKYPLGAWPPAQAGWFYHHRLYWVDEMPEYAGTSEAPFNMMAEHHYTYDNYQGEIRAPQHAGIKFLGSRFKPAGGQWTDGGGRVAWRWWDWEPGSLARDNDHEKYALLSEDGIDDWTAITPSPDTSGDSPVQILSVGPWDLYPGGQGQDSDLLELAFAFVAGDDFDDLIANALFAQVAYNSGFKLSGPPHSPRVHLELGSGRLAIYWDDSPEWSPDNDIEVGYDFEGYRIYLGRSPEEASFELIKQFDAAQVPARNPDIAPGGEENPYGIFTQAWLEAKMSELGLASEQAVLDYYAGAWPGDDYLYHPGVAEPYLVTERSPLGYNTGFGQVALPADEWLTGDDGTVYKYRYVLAPVSDGHQYWVAVTSYDRGDNETPSLESGVSQNVVSAVPGRSPTGAAGQTVTVFPNPYRGSAVWDRNRATGRYVWFAGLPSRALIKIFTLAGDLVAQIDFDQKTYKGQNAAGIFAGSEGDHPPVLSGTMAAWDLRSHNGQPVATGLYLFSVTDKRSGESQQGKFLVLK